MQVHALTNTGIVVVGPQNTATTDATRGTCNRTAQKLANSVEADIVQGKVNFPLGP